jgi:hypothetical protein
MRAELKNIQSNDYLKWDAFVRASRRDSSVDSGWFTVEIGPDDGVDAGETFQVLVVAQAAIARIKPGRGEFRCVVAESLDPDTVVMTLRKKVSMIKSRDWLGIRDRLRKSMWWERENVKSS